MEQIIFYILLFLLALSLIGVAIVFSFVIPVIQGAPFVASDRKKLGTIVSFADIRDGTRAVDLGSGEGRIVLALAEAGAEAYGYEWNPFLVWYSRRKAKKMAFSGKAFFQKKNFWKEDFSGFDVVILFGITHMMERLREKLEKELQPGARVVSNAFHIPGWKEEKRENGVILYIKE
ncbi:MAG: methyltransferase domain-containing protein [Candidatus Magasanikbacteria bacterium]